MRYAATIMWVDTKETQDDVIFKVGDVEDDDDQIFFYLEDESEIENFKKEGVADFIILNIDKEDGNNCRRCKDDEGYGRIKLCNSCRDDMRS